MDVILFDFTMAAAVSNLTASEEDVVSDFFDKKVGLGQQEDPTGRPPPQLTLVQKTPPTTADWDQPGAEDCRCLIGLPLYASPPRRPVSGSTEGHTVDLKHTN